MSPKHHYEVSVSTNSEYAEAGTLSRVQMRVMGKDGEKTEWITLNSFLPDIIKTGESRTYKLETPDVGKPILVEMRLFGQNHDPWYCNEISVKHQGKNFEFPFYDWLDATEVAIGEGKGCLPQHEKNDYVKEKRREEVERNRSKFAWMPNPAPDSLSYGFPRHLAAATVDELPLFFHWTDVRSDNFEEVNSVANDMVARNVTANLKLDSLDSFKQIAAGLVESQPPFIDVWDTDEEFGRQLLNGILPLIVEKCNELPSYCNIKNSDCALPQGCTLEEEIKAGHIFISDIKSITEGVPPNPNPTTKEPLFAPLAVALFHAGRHGSFLPIAIQLTPNDPESIFSPNDSRDDWLLAKMYFQSGKISIHEWTYHYLRTHAVTEAIAIATFRNLPRSHPVYKLLRPGLRTCVRVNTVARALLLPPLRPANLTVALSAGPMARKSFSDFNFSLLDIPKLFVDKGTDDEHVLKGYHYRDDALAIWDRIEDYVDDVIDEYYHSNELLPTSSDPKPVRKKKDLMSNTVPKKLGNKDVVNDFELQAWTDDIGREGFGWFDGNRRGMPESIRTVEELHRICTMILFNCTAQHAAVNFGQVEIYQFPPNNPSSMRLPVHKKGEANLERILASLPDVTIASFVVGITYSLSQYADNEVYLGEVPHQLFTWRRVKKHQKRFARKLKALSRKMHRRNRRLKIPYTYLLPERIPNSVAA